jgi:fibronectin-binding autotransporter adhesin
LDNLFTNNLNGFTMNATSGVAIDTTAGNFTYGSNISGIRKITKLGSNTLTLNGTNTFTGAVAVEQGVLNIQSSSALGTTGGATIVSSGAALELQGNITVAEGLTVYGTGVSSGGVIRNISGNNTISGTINPGTVQIGNGTDAGSIGATSAITNNGSLVYNVGSGNRTQAAVISGTGSLAQNSAGGTLKLTGNNTYTGTTNVNGVTLLVNGKQSTATGNVTVASGATLGGNGTLGGTTTITGILSPGNNDIGTLNVASNVTWQGASSNGTATDWIFQLGASNTADLLNITGNFTKDATTYGSNFRFDFAGSANTGTFKLVGWTSSSSFNASDFSYTNLGSGLTGSFSVSGSQLDFSVFPPIPEPSTWVAMVALILTGGSIAMRRRSRQVTENM